MTTPEADQGAPALLVDGLSKAFVGTQALQDVSLAVQAGELHCLLGGNGSGKSTLIKILAGIYSADKGSITVHGQELAARELDPQTSRRLGLRFVHQQPGTFADLDVAQNLGLGTEFPSHLGRIRWRQLHQHAEHVLERFGIDARSDDRLSSLRPAAQTMVAIARALSDVEEDDNAILVLDEPTAALPRTEVDTLLSALEGYATAGHTIIYVTHRLAEVKRIASKATVLRNGRVAARLDQPQIGEERLVEEITGGQAAKMEARPEPSLGDVALTVRDLRVGPIRALNLDLRHGEILGVAGLLGSGRTTLLEAIFGLRRPEGGRVVVDGKPWEPSDPSDAIRQGVAYLPEDRVERGIFPDSSISKNLTAPFVTTYRRRLRISRKAEAADARKAIERYQIKSRSERDPISILSGGNQQKVMFGRWLARSPRLVLLDEPTQGVDVGARYELYAAARAAAAAGSAVLLVSSDFEELAEFADRIVVLREGQITAELKREHLDTHAINKALHL